MEKTYPMWKFNLLFCFALVILMPSCINTLKGHLGESENIAESKKNEVFVCELCPDKNPYKVNDSLIISIKEAWVEHMWAYTGWHSKPEKRSGYQLCIALKTNSLKTYNNKWCLGNSVDSAFVSDEQHSLCTEFEHLPDPIVFKYKIYEGSFLFGSIGKQIGLLVLRKKIVLPSLNRVIQNRAGNINGK